MLIISDSVIQSALKATGWRGYTPDEGKLMLLELLAKAASGSYNSHAEEAFLSAMQVMKKDRKPNKRGFYFICEMVYASSNKRPVCFDLMKQFRN